jgi:hypothetical protein
MPSSPQQPSLDCMACGCIIGPFIMGDGIMPGCIPDIMDGPPAPQSPLHPMSIAGACII